METAKKVLPDKKDINTEKLSKNLKKLLKTKGENEVILAKALNLPYMTIRRLTSGTITNPKLHTLQLIADYFSVPLDALVSNEIVTHLNQTPRIIPILTWETLSETEDTIKLDFRHFIEKQAIAIPSQANFGYYTYAIESRKSMQPFYQNGTILVVDPEASVQDGDIVLVKIKETREISLRKLIIEPPHWYLDSIIAGVPRLEYLSAKHNIIGVVIVSITYSRKISTT